MVLIQSEGLDIYDIYRECEMNSTYTMGLLALLKDFLTENSSITEALKTGNTSKEGAFEKTVLTSFRKVSMYPL
ncbi:hypothetical protein OESDEN_17424 [Oesophagostomum dentatum]|uniref:Uncharacterized protein n=1 Tax=Oesophagostomum dentatum TaxID=61180 RepID=A0A0B1SG50_OESDE|nr:hypothetical protein OESDEN_17424 [Oesophagostomum dentatum]